jgi:hypothetical protein
MERKGFVIQPSEETDMPKKYWLKSRAGKSYISEDPTFIVNEKNPKRGEWTREELDVIYATPQWDFFPKYYKEELVPNSIDVMYKPNKRRIRVCNT